MFESCRDRQKILRTGCVASIEIRTKPNKLELILLKENPALALAGFSFRRLLSFAADWNDQGVEQTVKFLFQSGNNFRRQVLLSPRYQLNSVRSPFFANVLCGA